MIVVITFICILPSLWLGVDAQLKLKAEGGMVALVVVLVVLAPLAFLVAGRMWKSGHGALAAGIAAFGILAFTFNLVNAIGSVSVSRATTSDTRGAAIDSKHSRDRRNSDIQRQLSQLQKTSQGDSPEMVRAAIRKLQADPIYGRARKCEAGFVTKADSQELCGQIAGHEARLAAALKIDELQAEQKTIWAAATSEESAPSSKDPQVATIRAWLGLISASFDDSVDTLISAGLVGFAALMAEIAGAFGPSVVLLFIENFARGAAKTDAPVKSPAARKPLRAPKKVKPVKTTGAAKREATAEDVSAWAAERLISKPGEAVKAGGLQQDFAVWCAARSISIPSAWPNKFAAALAALGYSKVRARHVLYQNIAINPGAALRVASG